DLKRQSEISTEQAVQVLLLLRERVSRFEQLRLRSRPLCPRLEVVDLESLFFPEPVADDTLDLASETERLFGGLAGRLGLQNPVVDLAHVVDRALPLAAELLAIEIARDFGQVDVQSDLVLLRDRQLKLAEAECGPPARGPNLRVLSWDGSDTRVIAKDPLVELKVDSGQEPRFEDVDREARPAVALRLGDAFNRSIDVESGALDETIVLERDAHGL